MLYILNLGGGGADFASLIPVNFQSVDEFEAIKLYRKREIDGIVLTFPRNTGFDRNLMDYLMRTFKLHGVEKLIMLVNYPWGQVQVSTLMDLQPDRFFLEYIETHLIDGCNLNCRSCGHFASLFSKDEVYPLDEFHRDMRRLSHTIDLAILRMMGGEPFLLKNLDEYVKIARRYFPRSILLLVSNGLLIPSTDPKIFRAIRENNIVIDVTEYPPTTKIKDQIARTLTENQVKFLFGGKVEEFRASFLRDKLLFNPFESMKNCSSRYCFFLRHGKMYKCPSDALNYKFAQRFPAHSKHLPPSSGIDLFDANFLEHLQHIIYYPVQTCEICPSKRPLEPWRIENNPTADDWIH